MLSEAEVQKIYDVILVLRYEQNISNVEVIKYLDAQEDAYANVLSRQKSSECSTCHKTDAEVPLFPFIQGGKSLYTCVGCYHDNLDKKDEDEERASELRDKMIDHIPECDCADCIELRERRTK